MWLLTRPGDAPSLNLRPAPRTPTLSAQHGSNTGMPNVKETSVASLTELALSVFAEWTLPSRCLQWKRGHRSHTSAALKKAKSKYHQTVKLNSALSQSSSCFPDLQLCLLITGGHPRRDGRDTVTENKKHRSLSYLQMGGGGFRWTETTKVEHCHLENKP